MEKEFQTTNLSLRTLIEHKELQRTLPRSHGKPPFGVPAAIESTVELTKGLTHNEKGTQGGIGAA